MKLNLFNSQTMPRSVGRGSEKNPRVSISKTGVIMLNKTATSLMAIKPGDKISFGQEETESNDASWYVFKDDLNGFTIREPEFKKSGCAAFNHTSLAKELLASYGIDEHAEVKTICINIDDDPIEMKRINYYCLLSKV